MKRFLTIIAFIYIAFPIFAQGNANRYYMSFFARYNVVALENYNNKGYCLRVDMESDNKYVAPSLYIKYSNIENFIINLEIVKSQFIKYTKQSIKDRIKNIEIPLDSYFKRAFIVYNTRTRIYEDDNIKLKALFEVKEDGQCLAVIESPEFHAQKGDAVGTAHSFMIFQTSDEFDDLINTTKKLIK
ncbi:MAG: hypothetical protein ACTTJK_06920 [Phocaeicola sp.]|uniref:hypothetical protein n=1 Tax=Phocaeicola sp. TaxID=2773926 RepID=UPI003FA0ACE5